MCFLIDNIRVQGGDKRNQGGGDWGLGGGRRGDRGPGGGGDKDFKR